MKCINAPNALDGLGVSIVKLMYDNRGDEHTLLHFLACVLGTISIYRYTLRTRVERNSASTRRRSMGRKKLQITLQHVHACTGP